MIMMRRFVNSKYHETLYFVITVIFMAGCRIWWTYSQMAIGSTLIALDIVMQLIYRDKKLEKKYEKILNIVILSSMLVLALWSFYHWNVPMERDALF